VNEKGDNIGGGWADFPSKKTSAYFASKGKERRRTNRWIGVSDIERGWRRKERGSPHAKFSARLQMIKTIKGDRVRIKLLH